MADVRITRIRLAHASAKHEFITHVGNDTGTWMKEQVVFWIEQGMHSFYVQDDDRRRTSVGVVHERGKHPYLRTVTDGRWSDHLLALPSRD